MTINRSNCIHTERALEACGPRPLRFGPFFIFVASCSRANLVKMFARPIPLGLTYSPKCFHLLAVKIDKKLSVHRLLAATFWHLSSQNTWVEVTVAGSAAGGASVASGNLSYSN